jgi:DNA-binding CsgD family transcriptional regulator
MKNMEPLLAKLFEKGSLENVELWHVKKDGTLFPVLSNATVISDQNGTPLFISTTAIDLTERKKMESEMEVKNRDLDEANIALRVVIGNGEKQRAEQKERVVSNIRSLLKPSVEKLRQSGLTVKQETYLDTLESNIDNIVAPAVETLSSKYPNLSPTEIQVASFVKEGKKTPEIAQMLHVSNRTVEVHRNHIRKKLGIKDQKVNLHTFLMSIK